MEMLISSCAGTLESGDAYVQIDPTPGAGIVISLKSSVERQFGDQIRAVVQQTLEELGVRDAHVSINDMGALDPIIAARVAAAAYRGAKSQNFVWEV